MKNRKVHAIIFSVILIAFIVYYFCCMPTYVVMKFVGPHDSIYFIWCEIRELILNNDILHSFYNALVFKIPEYTMPIAIIINGANMIFGFVNYKKKWWYYLILVITIIMSIMLWDCFQILIHEEDMV